MYEKQKSRGCSAEATGAREVPATRSAEASQPVPNASKTDVCTTCATTRTSDWEILRKLNLQSLLLACDHARGSRSLIIDTFHHIHLLDLSTTLLTALCSAIYFCKGFHFQVAVSPPSFRALQKPSDQVSPACCPPNSSRPLALAYSQPYKVLL